MNEQAFNIQFVSNMTGINPHTIRAWEKRYQAVVPRRDEKGRRLYSRPMIERLELLNKLVKMGNNISEVAGLDSEDLKNILGQFKVTDSRTQNYNENFDFQQTLQSVFLGIEFYKLDIFNHELSKCRKELSTYDYAIKIIAPVVNKIRELRQADKLTFDDRASLFLILKSHLYKKLFADSHPSEGERIILAAAKGNLNELGTTLAAIIALESGLDIDFLGSQVDASSLADIANQYKVKHVFVGLNYSPSVVFTNSDKEKYLEVLIQKINPQTHVHIGAYDFCFNVNRSNVHCYETFEQLKDAFQKLSKTDLIG